MNLYRSFGNLMETWVTEGCPDSEWLESSAEDSLTPSSDMGANLRSESVDSGVETASCDTSFPATSCFGSTDNAEVNLLTPQTEGLTPASMSPALSPAVPSSSLSSSPRLCPSRAEEGSTTLHLKVERPLQRPDSKHLKDNPRLLTADEMLSRWPRPAFLPKRHTSEIVRGQRSEIFGLRQTVKPSVPVRQMSDVCRRPLSVSCDRQRSEGLGVEERKDLSPGLSYLEQVCQMLEEIAKHQMHNRSSQMETDALWEHQDTQMNQAPDSCQSDSTAAEEDLCSWQRLETADNTEHSSGEQQQRKYGHFRQRSASDTALATLHLRKLNANCRGQHLSTDDLLEKAEVDHEIQESTKDKTNKTNKNWRLKIGSLRREDSAVSYTKGQQMQSSEKNSARRRLSQLFRRRGKTQP
ncbi:uncharacterized protein [Embiotoca jacksoni]|uniref:uncharacterized protein n=1 Tax=Embiotoca jacksoni TaxID=100190 RepID=UPI0037047C17